ncbi:MAG: RNA polymerase sigma-70 factor [Bacteroidota bacterium]
MLDLSQHKVLVEHLKLGDERAYTFLIDQYHHLLCNFAYALIRNRNKAEDIVQNVFLKLWERRLELNTELSLNSYLRRLTYNEFVDTYRKQKSISSVELRYHNALNAMLEQEDFSDKKKLMDLVNKEIDKLPFRCREIFVMSKKEGLTNKEISDYLDISIKAVEAQISKAFSRLRNRLMPALKNLYLFLVMK